MKKRKLFFLFLLFQYSLLWSQSFNSSNYNYGNQILKVADLDSDGIMDIIYKNIISNYPHNRIQILIQYKYDENSPTLLFDSYGLYNDNSVFMDMGDFDNDNDIDLLYSGIDINGSFQCALFKNNGNSFQKISTILNNEHILGDIKWVDLNRDGLLDIIISGKDEYYYPSLKMFLNKRNDVFLSLENDLPPIQGAISICDFNRDGLLDFSVVGKDYNENNFRDIFINHNDGQFTRLGLQIPYFVYSAKLQDIDADGLTDIILGIYKNFVPTIIIYQNTFSGYIEIDVGPVANNNSSSIVKIETLDFNNDGNLDILAGTDFSSISLFENISTGFILNCTLTGNSFELEDINADNKIDIISQNIYFNSTTNNWSSHGAPINPRSIVFGTNVSLIWDNSLSNLNPNEFTYNLEIIGNNNEILLSSLTYDNCKKKMSDPGNIGQLDSITFYNIAPGQYTFRIQSIDKNNRPSEFSTPQTFTIKSILEKYQSYPGYWGSQVSIGDYDNDSDLDLFIFDGVYENSAGTFSKKIIFKPSWDGSKWVDLDNDDDLDLILQDSIYVNDNGIFKGVFFIGPGRTSIADADNDGDYDILSGKTILINELGFIFKQNVLQDLSGISKFVDFDMDGDFDILAGNTLYEKDHSTYSKKVLCPSGNIYWYDLDNDGDQDYVNLIQGSAELFQDRSLKIYENKFGEFYETNNYIKSYWDNKLAFGDFNNDGLTDFVVSEYNSGNGLTIYLNSTGMKFHRYLSETIGGDNISLADFDNDNDLDLTTAEYLIKNNGHFPKTLHESPTGLTSQHLNYGIFLKWDELNDGNNSGSGLSYNLRIGVTPIGCEIMSPMSDPVTGYRRIPEMGNVQLNKGWRLDSLPEGKYYWSVQAIDQSYMGGPWAPEQTFTISVVRADFEAPVVCAGTATQFTDKSLSSAAAITSWKWDFGDGSTSTEQNPSHTYASAGNYNVKLVASSSEYSDSLVKTITVLPKATASFSADPVCHGTSTIFQNTSGTNGLTVTSWQWDLGDKQTSALQNPPEHFYAQPGTYTVKLKVTTDNGCADTISKKVIVGEYPVVILSANGPLEFCSGSSVKLSVAKKDTYLYQWKLSDVPLTDSTASRLTVINSGEYSVTVNNSVANCISNSTKVGVTVTEKPAKPAVENAGDVSGICEGTVQVELEVRQPSSSYAYQWKRDGTPIDNATGYKLPRVLYPGNYSVSASVKGCSVDSDPVPMNFIEALPKPILYVQGPVVWYMAASNDSAANYKWYLNNELIEGAGRYIYMANKTLGTYKVAIANKEGCVTMSDEVTIPVSKGAMTKFNIPADYLKTEDIDPFLNLKIYPNPTPGLFTIEMDNNIFGELVIDIFTQEGRKILNIKFEKTTEHFKSQVDFSGQKNGMYVLNFILDKFFASRKLLVE